MSEIDDTPAPALVHRNRGGRLILLVLALLALFGTLVYLLREPARRQLARLQAATTTTTTEVAPAVPEAAQVAALAADLDAMRQRVDALERRVAVLSVPPALPAAPAAALSPGPVAVAGGSDPIVVALSARLDALSGRQDRLDAQVTDQGSQLKSDAARLEAAGNQASAVSALTDRAARLARVQAAEAALASGLPLGSLPGAPAALARFGSEAPPTEAQLRVAFPRVAAAARAAARPDTGQLGFWRAMRERAASLITVRRGDTVLVGSSQVGAIDRARAALDAGDLAGAVATLGELDGPAAAAVADWRGRAQALLDARLALARLASQS